jgi:FlaA1/EpsC-like NDP-sugar epimerase
MSRKRANAWVTPLKIALDGLLVCISLVAAYMFRFGFDLPPEHARELMVFLPWALVIKLLVFAGFGNYATVWRYSSVNDLVRLGRSAVVGTLLLVAFLYVASNHMPRGIPPLDLVLTLTLCGGLRLAPRLARERLNPAGLPHPVRAWFTRPMDPVRRVLVVGAGDAGESLVREMARKSHLGYLAIGFVDDDPNKKGMRIHGVKVRGTRDDIPRLVAQHEVDEILIAIPSATAEQIRPLVDICRDTGVKLKILPDLASLVDGPPRLSDVRELQIEDVLGRPRIEMDIDTVSAYVKGRSIMVTGAGGSIGAELCRQLMRYEPAELLLFGRGENSIHAISQELNRRRGNVRVREVIGDVINKKKLYGVFDREHPEIVFHAGADKHVPLMELNPDEAVLNNVLGTRNVIEVCNEFRVRKLVCISTDKAVNPTSIMGCCKRVAELYVRSPRYEQTVVTAVRFGNVLGSRGSVVPVFQKQIERGGPVTVTHKKVRRFFMTIPEAVALVIQAGALAQGGEIYVLDMGEPMLIDDLARRVIRLHGLEPDKDIKVAYSGLRPGEKLDEELVGWGEQRKPTDHPKIFKVISASEVSEVELDDGVSTLIRQAVEMDDAGIRATLRTLVPQYHPYQAPQVESWTTKDA